MGNRLYGDKRQPLGKSYLTLSRKIYYSYCHHTLKKMAFALFLRGGFYKIEK